MLFSLSLYPIAWGSGHACLRREIAGLWLALLPVSKSTSQYRQNLRNINNFLAYNRVGLEKSLRARDRVHGFESGIFHCDLENRFNCAELHQKLLSNLS